MISRQWCAVAKHAAAERYVAHLKTETLPQLAGLAGFLDASILRRPVADGVEFRIVTRWASIEAISGFAGADLERAVVPAKVAEMMVRYDHTVAHYEVVE